MSDSNNKEERAFDALVVSQLQRGRDIMKAEDLPPLTDEELAALNSIPAGIIDDLWQKECNNDKGDDCEGELAGAASCPAEDAYFGLNRANDMADEDQETLDESRKAALEELKRQRSQRGEDHA